MSSGLTRDTPEGVFPETIGLIRQMWNTLPSEIRSKDINFHYQSKTVVKRICDH